MDQAEPAVKFLQMAADGGFPCYPLFDKDPDLDNLRQNPRFLQFMAGQKRQWQQYMSTL